jgi:hypothetical protein
VKWARQEQFLLQIAEDTGSMPNALATKPALSSGGASILRSFDVLDNSRLVYEGGPQAIQVGEILAFLEIAKIEEVEDRLLFLNTIKTLDVIYLNHFAESNK